MTHEHYEPLSCTVETIYTFFAHEQASGEILSYIKGFEHPRARELDYICRVSFADTAYLREVDGEQFQLLAFIGSMTSDRHIILFVESGQQLIKIGHCSVLTERVYVSFAYHQKPFFKKLTLEQFRTIFRKIILHFGMDLQDL